MKHFILSLGLCLLVLGIAAQHDTGTGKPTTWNFTAVKSADKTYTLVFKAAIEKGWKLFSTTMKDDEPNTRIKPDSSALAFIAVINNKETGDLKSAKEPLLGDMPIRYFEKNAGIEVTVQVNDISKDIKGVISYMAIRGDSVVGPEEVPFRFSFDAAGNLVAKQAGLAESKDAAQLLKRSAID
ncbi:MAG: cytochrome C biogenesis protein, partial [Bacteroidota bacterium]